MSNAVTHNVVPDFLKKSKPTGKFAAVGHESLAEGIGSSYPILGYKGKIWSIRHRGENHILTRQDDGSPVNYVDLVILRQAKQKSKSFYDGKFDEASSAGQRPKCASLDGIKPDDDVPEKQSDVCSLCPRNKFYTNEKGRKTRDCADYKRLAVLLLPSQTKHAMGEPLVEPAFLRVPPDSLNDLGLYGDMLDGQGWPFSAVVTRISFDSTKSHPKFVYKAVQSVGTEEEDFVLSLIDDIQSKRITGEAAREVIREEATLDNSPERKYFPVRENPYMIEAKAEPEKPPAEQTDEDTGMVEDNDLDARIKAMLKL